jgi:hypothetical protein
MKQYKKEILKGFEKRKFDLTELHDGESLPWWIEEKWILSGMKSDNRNDKLYVIFLTDKQWESGTKIVDEILVTTSEMENYSDYNSKIAELDMRKGDFTEKKEVFWMEFDKK